MWAPIFLLISLVAALINVVFGLLIAWVLVRYEFPFKRFFDAVVAEMTMVSSPR